MNAAEFQGWQLGAACRNHPNPDLWFPGPGNQDDQIAEATAICRTCPVLAQCTAWTERFDPPWGIWAGTTKKQRDNRRGRKPSRIDPWVAAALSNCGTPAGYARHKRLGETPCQSCKDAEGRYRTTRRERAC